jgi:hypothetical protein
MMPAAAAAESIMDSAMRLIAARHVLDVGIEPAVLVDHQHGTVRTGAARLHQVAAHGARRAAGRRIAHVCCLDARVGEGDRLRLRVARQQRLRHCEPARRHRGGARQKLAAVDRAVAILVVEIEHALIDLALRDGSRLIGDRRYIVHCGIIPLV